METPVLEGTMKGVFYWLKWKIAYLVYLLCAGVPIAICITCMMTLAIARRSTIVLPIIITVMLHPVVMIPFGIITKIVEENLSFILFKPHTNKTTLLILKRLLTFSVNLYLALISGLIYYLYNIWIMFEVASTMNFSNEPFDQCPCAALSENDIPCINKETENSFQNIFLGVSIQPFLIIFMVTSIVCHVIHSSIMFFPTPINILDYILGHKALVESEIESNSDGFGKTNRILCCILSITYIVLALTCPSYTFDTSVSKGKSHIRFLFLID